MDGGANWSNAILSLPAGFTGAEAAVVTYAFPNLFYITAHAFPGETDGTTLLYVSADNGATFGAPIVVMPGFGTYINNDETHVLADTGQSSPYPGNLYVLSNHQFNVDNSAGSTAFFRRSTDGGQTWNQPVLLSNPDDQVERPDAAVDLTGNLYTAWITTEANAQFFVRPSADGGASFQSPIQVASVVLVRTFLPVAGYAFRVLTFANISADRSNGPNNGAAQCDLLIPRPYFPVIPTL
ncbi:hypothetical protein IDH44_16165 [Paenibacillus sp. IB182496]|uniref:Exo-alpha-sialidase n=1 Tax=Paenibacillus sabuli TaxID=2772509 RepID=A0A927BTW8_9BACL|nr:sialidase family protein [Paenibacillus sabuli]MBD2846732.1 hypothetical protein [Paenibacillus sabuli]